MKRTRLVQTAFVLHGNEGDFLHALPLNAGTHSVAGNNIASLVEVDGFWGMNDASTS